MATVVYRDAYLLVNGAAIHGELTELTVEVGAESLDNTKFGNTTRVHMGGLLTGRISGAGHANLSATGAEALLSSLVAQANTVLTAFPNGITEGASATAGYAMIGVIPEFQWGGAVGVLLPFSFAADPQNPAG